MLLNKIIKKYIRDDENMKIGMFLAGKNEKNELKIGFCSLHPSDHGKFDKKLAEKICIGRAIAEKTKPNRIPNNVIDNIPDFLERCNKYYKGDSIPNWISKILTDD
jgi:hypothetical protein